MSVLRTILGWLTGSGIIGELSRPILEAQRMRLEAENDADRLRLDAQIASMQVTRDIAIRELDDRWSATRIGRNLIVIPYGIWWAAIYAVQIANPWFIEPLLGTKAVVYDVPPHINEMALVLVPAIVLGDAFKFAATRMKR